jgi:Zn-dependent metalloprotease
MMIGPSESWSKEANVDFGNGLVRERAYQVYNGPSGAVRVWNGEYIGISDANGVYDYAIGNVMQGLDADLAGLAPTLSADRATEIVAAGYQNSALNNTQILDREPTTLWVAMSPYGKATYQYRVTLTVGGADQVNKIVTMIDARTGQINSVDRNMLQTVAARGTGPGGNGRTGQYEHNQTSGLGVALNIDKVGTTCRLANPNTLVVNARNGQGTGSTAISYTCNDANNRFVEPTVNGGFGVSADILAFGDQTTIFYKTQLNTQPLKCSNLLVQYAHVMVQYDNAFYTGCQMRYGDGRSFYPLVSTDVVAHEISHGVTEGRSNLVYQNQSGGLNESYSDQAGITFTAFLTGSTQGFQIGSQISKTGQPLRFMATPSRDGSSIDNVNQFRTGLDPHFGSGPPNRYFTILAQSPGYDALKALRVSYRANDMLWTSGTTYVQMGNALCRAATDLQFDTAPVRQALVAIGLNPTGCNGGGTPNPGGNVLQSNVPVSVGTLATGATRTFTATVPAGRTTITFRLTGNNGDADLYVRRGAAPTTTVNDGKSEGPTSNETVTLTVPAGGGTYNVLLNGFATASGLSLVASF